MLLAFFILPFSSVVDIAPGGGNTVVLEWDDSVRRLMKFSPVGAQHGDGPSTRFPHSESQTEAKAKTKQKPLGLVQNCPVNFNIPSHVDLKCPIPLTHTHTALISLNHKSPEHNRLVDAFTLFFKTKCQLFVPIGGFMCATQMFGINRSNSTVDN